MESQNALYTLSRRNWLRTTALTATGVAVLPALLNSCIEDHRIPPGVGLGSPQYDNDVYVRAADNIRRLRDWYNDTHLAFNGPYINTVYGLIAPGDPSPLTLQDVPLVVFARIGKNILEVATKEVPFAGAAITLTAQAIDEWVSAQQKSSGDRVMGEFSVAYGKMVEHVSDALENLLFKDFFGRDVFYINLDTAVLKNGNRFINTIDNSTHSVEELAAGEFPNKQQDSNTKNEYREMQDRAVLGFKRLIWNVMFIQAATYHTWDTYPDEGQVNGPRDFVLNNYYTQKDVVAAYFRAQIGVYVPYGPAPKFKFREYSFRFNGEKLSAAAVRELFQDDVIGNPINPGALFARDYVFKQFRREKLDFDGYCELVETGPGSLLCLDSNFTGGNFPELVKK